MSLSRTCSHCGHVSQACSKCGHNSQTCNDGGEHSIMLFGVRITVATNNNNNNLSQYQQPMPQVSSSTDISTVSVSGNVVHASTGSRECKRFNEGVWTEQEHEMFLNGLKHIGKSKWKVISKCFVKTRTPTQVASHAQKYSLRRPNQSCRRRRKPNVFNTEVESSTIKEDEQIQQKTVVPLPPPTPTAYPSTQNGGSPISSPLPIVLGQVALPVWPLSWVDSNDNGSSSSTETFPLSMKLQTLPPSDDRSPETSGCSSRSTSSSAFNSTSTSNSSGGSGDSIINLPQNIV